MSKLTIALNSSDCGEFTTGNTFMNIDVLYEGEKVAEVNYSYFEYEETVKVKRIDMHGFLPVASSNLHLIAMVSTAIMRAFTDEHCFYPDVFDDGDLPLIAE